MEEKSEELIENRRKVNRPYDWKNHDSYDWDYCGNRIITRSQAAYLRIKSSKSNMDLFADPLSYQPPGLPHLLGILKGPYGSLPKTLITRSMGQHIGISKELNEKLEPYKDFVPEPQSSSDEPLTRRRRLKNEPMEDAVKSGVFACFGSKHKTNTKDEAYKKVEDTDKDEKK